MHIQLFLLLSIFRVTLGQPGKCDQTPPHAKILEPSENKGLFSLALETKFDNNRYLPAQTYVLKLKTSNTTRPFRSFMITAEDPDVDTSTFEFNHRDVDVGDLKTLDTDSQSRYSERCFSSVENTDNSDKYQIEVHWVSPKRDANQKVRLRAMVAENEEVWYVGENLTILLEKDDSRPADIPPLPPLEKCKLCSEARYEVIFQGQWSRMTHPRHYPGKPDNNGYSHMIGASHAPNYTLWKQGDAAKPGLKKLAEEADISIIEREIIDSMSTTDGTRTLIRGKRRHHPHMFEPSHSLFRVDRIHHMFSIAVAMQPSPDWFLGTSKFELCTDDEWLEEYKIPLYPWDAGTMDGISYESHKTMTQPVNTVERVEVGSFNRESPFYQMNLNDLKAFAYLTVRRLDVYPLEDVDCSDEQDDNDTEKNAPSNPSEEDPNSEPQIAESRQQRHSDNCILSEWSEWSSCVPHEGSCGEGVQTRKRYTEDRNFYYQSYSSNDDVQAKPFNCRTPPEIEQTNNCFIEC